MVPRVPERQPARVGLARRHLHVPGAHHLLQSLRRGAQQERAHDADGAAHAELHHLLDRGAAAARRPLVQPHQRLHHRHAHRRLRADAVHHHGLQPQQAGPDHRDHHRQCAAPPTASGRSASRARRSSCPAPTAPTWRASARAPARSAAAPPCGVRSPTPASTVRPWWPTARASSATRARPSPRWSP